MSDDKTTRAAEIEKAIRDSDAQATADAENGKKLDMLLEGLGNMGKRMDSMESRLDSLGTGEDPDCEARKRVASDIADSTGKTRIDRLEAENERRRLNAETQYRADSVFQAFGEDAPNPMSGEDPLDYRIRLAGRLQRHSSELKGADLRAIADSVSFKAIEDKIYADAMGESRKHSDVPAGQLREVTRVDRTTGIRMTEFYGPNTFILGMGRQRGRLVGRGFLTPQQ